MILTKSAQFGQKCARLTYTKLDPLTFNILKRCHKVNDVRKYFASLFTVRRTDGL